MRVCPFFEGSTFWWFTGTPKDFEGPLEKDTPSLLLSEAWVKREIQEHAANKRRFPVLRNTDRWQGFLAWLERCRVWQCGVGGMVEEVFYVICTHARLVGGLMAVSWLFLLSANAILQCQPASKQHEEGNQRPQKAANNNSNLLRPVLILRSKLLAWLKDLVPAHVAH